MDRCGTTLPHTSMTEKNDTPTLAELELFEREQAALREAQHIVMQWLQAIETARNTGEGLALLGYSTTGMDMTTVAAKLEAAPPVEYLQRLISARGPELAPF